MREAYYQKKCKLVMLEKIQGLQTDMLANIAVIHARQGFLQFRSSPGTPAKLALTSPRVLITHSIYFL